MPHLETFPPQGYTKETLVKAYEWLQEQPDSIRRLATSPDVLVSIFMKAKLQGEEALHRIYAQNFRSDLKEAAALVDHFEAGLGSGKSERREETRQQMETTFLKLSKKEEEVAWTRENQDSRKKSSFSLTEDRRDRDLGESRKQDISPYSDRKTSSEAVDLLASIISYDPVLGEAIQELQQKTRIKSVNDLVVFALTLGTLQIKKLFGR